MVFHLRSLFLKKNFPMILPNFINAERSMPNGESPKPIDWKGECRNASDGFRSQHSPIHAGALKI